MTARLATAVMGVALAVAAPVPSAGADEPSTATRLAIAQASRQADSFPDTATAAAWLAKMSRRLGRRVPNPFYRAYLLRLIHSEAKRADLTPELVLALIQVESGFDRFAVSRAGARGLMQIMPFWTDAIGNPDDDLFQPHTNLRYGCRILRTYLDRAQGDLTKALALYNGSAGETVYPEKVYMALRHRWQ